MPGTRCWATDPIHAEPGPPRGWYSAIPSRLIFEKLREVSDRVTMRVRWNGKPEDQRACLSEILDIVSGTGRQISAARALRYDDLRLDEGPNGAIRWPAED